MSPANAALTSDELTSLAKADHDVPYHLSFKAENVIAQATVSATPDGPSYAVVAVTGATNWTDVRDGMTAKFTDSTGDVLRGYYRVRRNSGDTLELFIEEVTPADQGIIAQGLRTDSIQVGDLITITDRFDLFSVKPSINNGTIYQDNDVALGTYNTAPEVIVNVTINSRPGDYVTEIASDDGTQHITATISVIKWPTSSGSTVTYAWSVPASWSGVSGGTSATLQADVPPGDYTLYCDVDDSVGGTTQIARWVRIHSPSDPPLSINITSDARDMNTRKMTIRAVKSVIANLPPGIKCAVWSDATWGGDDVPSATRTFVGYLYQQPFSHEPGFYETTADIYSTTAILDMLMCTPMTVKYSSSPATWEELDASLQTVQFIMWWVLRWRCANFLKCFNFTPFSTSDSIARKINIGISQGSIFSALKNLAEMYDATVGSRSDGEIIARQLPYMVSDRSGISNRLTLTNHIYHDIKVTWVRRATYGSVIHDGVFSDLTEDTAVAAQAPGLNTFGQGGAMDRQSNKIYEDEGDNKSRVAKAYAYLNSEFPSIVAPIWDNWDVFEPADCDIVTVEVPADKSPTGVAFSIDCIVVSVQKDWTPGRRARITPTLAALTDSVDSQSIPPSPDMPITSGEPPIFSLPPEFPSVSDDGGTVPTPLPNDKTAFSNGEELFACSAHKAYWVEQFLSLSSPQYTNITPLNLTSNYKIQHCLAIGVEPTVPNPGGFLLANTGGVTGHSAMWQSDRINVPAGNSITWNTGATFSHNYQIMRGVPVPGNLILYTSDTQIDNLFYDFKIDDQGWGTVAFSSYGSTSSPDTAGHHVGSAGWRQDTTVNDSDGSGRTYEQIFIGISFMTPITATKIVAVFDRATGTADAPDSVGLAFFTSLSGSQSVLHSESNLGPTGTNASMTWTGSATFDQLVFDERSGVSAPHDATDPGGSCTLKRIEIYVGGAGAAVITTTDSGATMGTEINVDSGDSPGAVGGFDLCRNSPTSYAAGKNKLRKATTVGGAYSDFYAITGSANCVCACIPYFRWDGTTDQTEAGDPDVIIALDQLDGSSRSLIWVEGDGTTVHDITPVGGIKFDSANCICLHSAGSNMIAVAGKVGGIGKIYVTIDRGTSWTVATADSGNVSAPTMIRARRENITPERGQIYAADPNVPTIWYSSHWGTVGLAPRATPSGIVVIDTIF